MRRSKLFLTGHRGLVGSAIHRALDRNGEFDVLTRTRQELDLTDQASVNSYLEAERPDWVIVAAGRVGGILANSTYPAEFIAENLMIEVNTIWGSHQAGVPNLLFLGSSCMYPRETAQPIPESALLSGPLEPTNAPYAVAKVAGLTLCDAIHAQFGRRYFTVMPPNVYGPGDNFDLTTSHVLAALIHRFHDAKPDREVVCWGTGKPRREFLYSDDVAEACVFLMTETALSGVVNVGTGASLSIAELARHVQEAVGHSGPVSWDTSKPDGFPEKTMDVTRIHQLGWSSRVDFDEGIRQTYEWYLSARDRRARAVPA